LLGGTGGLGENPKPPISAPNPAGGKTLFRHKKSPIKRYVSPNPLGGHAAGEEGARADLVEVDPANLGGVDGVSLVPGCCGRWGRLRGGFRRRKRNRRLMPADRPARPPREENCAAPPHTPQHRGVDQGDRPRRPVQVHPRSAQDGRAPAAARQVAEIFGSASRGFLDGGVEEDLPNEAARPGPQDQVATRTGTAGTEPAARQ